MGLPAVQLIQSRVLVPDGVTRMSRSRRWLLTIALVVVTNPVWAAPPVPNLSPSDLNPDEEVHITIRVRSFEPATLRLQAGKKTKLVLHNQDAELHTFVPVGLFSGLHLNVSGDGAPQFDAQGFKRVIIPSQGKTEIRFVPVRTGTFPYFCDMPGHEMSATIVVQ